MVSNTKPVYVIFGAAGGVGSVLSKKLAEDSCHLFLAGRTEGSLQALAEATGGSAIVTDVTDAESVKQCFEQVLSEHDSIHGVVNCVGSILLKAAHITKDEEWHQTLNLNLTSSFYILREAVKPMQKSGGTIVLLSTAAASIGVPNHEAIAAAKAGVEGLARSASATYARKGIRVNCVAPGLVDTPLAKHITGNDTALQASKGMHALGRIGQPEDIASCIFFLLQPQNDWITGQTFGVDGGLSSLVSRA